MKKIALLLLTISAIGFSQTKKLEKGTYKSKLSNEPIKLTVDESGNFNFVFLSGKLEYENDTIYFNRKSKELKSSFEIYEVDDKKMSANLKIDIDYNTKNYLGYNTYIAFQATENAPLNYKPATEYFGSFSENSFDNENKSETLEVEKAKYISLMSIRSEKPVVTKFEIPNGVNHIKLIRSASLNDLNLIGFFDQNNNLKITDGKSPVIFTLKTTDTDEEQPLKPLEIYTENNFYTKYGIQENEIDTIEAVDSAAAAVNDDAIYYDFKLKKFNSYKDALADTKNNKFLILIKSTDKTYNAIIENYQNDTKYSMYNGYDESKDNYNFYQATDKDKKLYNQYLKKEGIVVYNKDGDVLYYKEINLTDENPINNYDFLTELKKANFASQIDHTVTNKKATTDDLKKVFTSISKDNGYYGYDYPKVVEVAPAPPPPAPAIEGQEAITVEEAAKEAVKEATKAAAEAVREAAETTATTVDLPENVNFYKLKSPQDVVYNKWYAVVNENSTKPLDTLLLPTYKNAITNSAFIDNYFKKETINKNDLKIVDYLQKNYAKIKEYEDASSNIYYDQKTINCLNGFYNNQFGIENNPLFNDILDRYQYFIENISTSPSTFESYLYILENNKKDLNFILSKYNNYFNKTIPAGSNLIEALDKSYTESNAQDWDGFKSSFATLANNTAWKIVENRLTNDYLQKALRWSETSLQIEKNNPYYLDTLAQLYYLNGDREKAIATEQKAIDNISTNSDSDYQKENYTNVLQKMKEGKY